MLFLLIFPKSENKNLIYKMNFNIDIINSNSFNLYYLYNQSKIMKILLAEDDSMCQSAINNFSKKIGGIELDIANNGKEAFEKASSNNYDLILMDLFMPEMDGKEATELIRGLSNGSSFTIIALSGGNIFIS